MSRPLNFIIPLTLLFLGACADGDPKLRMETNQENTTVFLNGQAILSYVHSETPAPEGENPLYHRSAYIHPLCSPAGEVLTRIQPPDHWHHYGIWNPWTHTRIDTTRVDFWNLAEGQGRVRFAEYLDRFEGKKESGFMVRHEHVWTPQDMQEVVAINETWKILVSDAGGESYTMDMVVTLNCPLEDGILLEAYRYGGGLGFRATEKWGSDNSTILTSEGKTRKDADGSRGRWILLEGESSAAQGRSGILYLSHPDNREHPEPMRVWPEDQYDRKSNVFVEFCPIRHKEWKLEAGKDYILKYRLVVFDGAMSNEEAEEYWQAFSVL